MNVEIGVDAYRYIVGTMGLTSVIFLIYVLAIAAKEERRIRRQKH